MLVNKTVEWYELTNDRADRRVDGWLLVGTLFTPATISLLYLLTVWVGPMSMRDKQPFQLKWVLVCYNLGMVLLSVYMFYEFVVTSLLSNYSYVCQPVDYSNSELALRMAKVCWIFYISKIIELLDTVFFILRKKNEQITFLHVYHHSTMVLLFWIGTRYVPGGDTCFVGFTNCFVHIFMYAYYGLAAIGPYMQKYLWWKRYITRLQLVQFVLFVVHAVRNLYMGCSYPALFTSLLLTSAFSLFILFGNFYYKSFIKRKRDEKHKKTT